MKLKYEILLMFLGGLLRLCDLGSDVWYLMTQNMKKKLFFQISIASLAAPSIVLIIIYIFICISDCCKSKSFSKFKLCLFLLFIFGDSLGLNYFMFTFVFICSETLKGDFYVIDVLFRSTALINGLFHSIPQICLQVYNNQLSNNWNILTMVSISLSGLSLVYTLVKLVYAIDKVQQYESIYINTTPRQGSNKIGIGDSTANAKISAHNFNSENDEEVYDASP